MVAVVCSIVLSLVPFAIFPNWNFTYILTSGTSIIDRIGRSLNYGTIVFVLAVYHHILHQSIDNGKDSQIFPPLPMGPLARASCNHFIDPESIANNSLEDLTPPPRLLRHNLERALVAARNSMDDFHYFP
jgi:hypothetical protein